MTDSNAEPKPTVEKASSPPENQSSNRSGVSHLSRFLFWIAISLVAIIFGNGLFPRIWMVLDWIATFQLQIIMIVWLVVFFLCWKKQLKRACLLSLLIVWPSFGLASIYWPLNQPESATRSIRLLTFNVYDPSDAYDQALELINQEAPDVVGLVEFNGAWEKAFKGEMQDYPYRVGPYRDCVIFSKFPIKDQGNSTKQAGNPLPLPGLFCKFECDGQPVFLMLVHATSPKSTTDMAERNAQINGIQRHMQYASAFGHVVMAGDFNATTQSFALQTMLQKTRFRDSRQGFGLQHSWPTWFWPISICIDHCFVSKGVVVENRRTAANTGSDHLGVITDLSFSQRKK